MNCELVSSKGAIGVKKSAIISILLALSLLAAACGSDEGSSSTLKVGYAADLSDLGGFADMPASQAGEHFVALVNCAGGIDAEVGIDIDAVLATDLDNCSEVSGTTLEWKMENIAGDPEVTQRVSQSLIDWGASALLGPPFPDFGEPLLQVTAGEIPVLFVAST